MPSTAGDAGDAGGASAVAEEEQVLAGWLYKLAGSRVKTYKCVSRHRTVCSHTAHHHHHFT
jgi:hypothetical protein